MNPAQNVWPDTQGAQGVKFIAQAVRDLVNVGSFESFRAMSLDSPSRLSEAQKLLHDISKGLPRASFEPVARELKWSLEIDPAVYHRRYDEVRLLVDYLKSLQSMDKLDVDLTIRHIMVVHRRVSRGYKERLEEQIASLFKKPERRSELINVVSFYCSHLINIGYSRNYISALIQDRFFTGDVQKAGLPTIRRLFSAFSGADIRYRLFISVSEPFGVFMDGVVDGEILDYSQLPTFAANHFSQSSFHNVKNKYLRLVVSAKDPHSAARVASERLAAVRSMTVLAQREFNSDYDRGVLVAKLIANVAEVITVSPLQLQRVAGGSFVAGHIARQVRRQSISMAKNFDAASYERLVSALNSVSLARMSDNAENRLISLWSAMEVLLSDPPPGGVRILHYAKLIVPVIGVRYPRRSLIALYNGLLIPHRKRVARFLRSVGQANVDDPTRFLLGLTLPDFDDDRVDFIDKLSDNPIAQERIRRFIASWGRPDAAKQTMQGHEERVHWQIHRIYRARNQLVHAGRTPPYLDSLVINAFEYFRNTVGPVIGHAQRHADVMDVDQAVAELCLMFRAQHSALDAIRGQPSFNVKTAKSTFNIK